MKHQSVYRLTSCALVAALMCVLGPMSVPIGPVPVTLTNLVIYLSIFLLDPQGAVISVAVYLLLGAVGMPVFSNYSGGLAKLAGPTGGYLVGFLFVALIGGIAAKKFQYKPLPVALALVAGTAVLYIFGTIWFVLMMKAELSYALSVCVYPFIPFDLGKIVLASLFGTVLRNALLRAKLLPEAK